MDLATASRAEKGRPSLEAENKKLLGYYDRLEDELDSTSTWIGEDDTPRRSRKWRPNSATVWRWAIISLQIICSVLVGAALGYVLKPGCTELECVRMTSSYSPLLEAVEYYDYQFEAELDAENVYKGHPRPELDEAWTRVGKIHPLSMPEKYRAELNKTNSGIPYPKEQGGGIMVEIEVFHQLHCLNFIRKVIYADYYSRPENLPIEFEVTNKLFFNHVDHCIDYLRQVIMCESDVTPVTSNWVFTHHTPHPDFNTMHKCRNFTKLLEWVEEHDNGGVPRQTPNPSWKPAPGLAETILDYENDFPMPPHGPPVTGKDKWGHD
ncbi:hypothetical protein N5P37_006902 [Trichoderma harzianum]|uniref:Tat pathway signal sequence n=1 Tax=Trichoderma harzianum CBS 226.95 TaxID=983964 RepID=A0A2T4A2H5_TRIHA|nr:hypothetical protein M431DRAFT_533497 [Trichoderma harzianum CBS 226.95]KAK0760705.1 hypothetical protein N5P37_006902 [Trichoderma harzianum]PKK53182.1 hypothetical protein CI102_1595 [Trichoderma harzianum]PTB51238.1 hypothetical protein M431DRAFT_533497 [Trichoderma harzianum CBS 226.95]